MRWLIASAAAAAVVGVLAVTAPAQAQDCPFKVGDYVQVPWIDNVITPAIVLGMKEDCANYSVRLFEDDDPKTPSRVGAQGFRDYQVAPLVGEPPHRKPFACPFATGEAIDYLTYSNEWLPGTVGDVDAECRTIVSYRNATGADETTEVAGYSTVERLRPQQAAPEPIVGAACDSGETFDTVADSDEHAKMKRAVLTHLAGQQPGASNITLDFQRIREGKSFNVDSGGLFLKDNGNAAINTAVRTYRITAELCVETPGQATTKQSGDVDYFCYEDSFADVFCVLPPER